MKCKLENPRDYILMTRGIVSTEISAVDNDNVTKSYVIKIMFINGYLKEFAKITEENIREKIGIYLNEDMITNPTVISVITGGSCNIQGKYLRRGSKTCICS